MYPSTQLPLTVPIIKFIFKDISLLDRVGLQYPCRDHSFNISNRFLRSTVRQHIFIHLLIEIYFL